MLILMYGFESGNETLSFVEIAEQFQLHSGWKKMTAVALKQFLKFYKLHLIYSLVNP